MKIHYKLRITLTHTNIADVLSTIDKISPEYAYVEEKGKQEEHPHVHLYLIVDKSYKEDTIRTKLRKLTKSARGNKLYSLVKLDVEEGRSIAIEYLAYMMKEGEVRYIGVWIGEDVDEALAYDATVKEEIKQKKEKRKSRYQRLDESFTSSEMYKCKTYDSNSIIMFVIDFMSKEGSTISVSSVEGHCNTLLMKYDETYALQLSTLISKRLFSHLN